ncbi:hypothetical protein ACWGTI_19580 [Mesorhizobium sp. ArgA1]
MKPYKVIYHQGGTVGWSTKAMRGTAEVSERGLTITGAKVTIDIPASDIQSVELFRMFGTGSMLKIVHDGGTLFVTVIRFMIGQFATVNFFATGALQQRLLALTDPAPKGPWTHSG